MLVTCSPKTGPATMRVQRPTYLGIRRTLYGQTTLPGADRLQAAPGRSPRSTPTVIVGVPLLLSSTRADPPSWAIEPVEYLQTIRYCVLGGRPSHLNFRECVYF